VDVTDSGKTFSAKMRFLVSALISFLALAGNALARSSTGDSVLVVLDPSLKREDYSKFFGGLEGESILA